MSSVFYKKIGIFVFLDGTLQGLFRQGVLTCVTKKDNIGGRLDAVEVQRGVGSSHVYAGGLVRLHKGTNSDVHDTDDVTE